MKIYQFELWEIITGIFYYYKMLHRPTVMIDRKEKQTINPSKK